MVVLSSRRAMLRFFPIVLACVVLVLFGYLPHLYRVLFPISYAAMRAKLHAQQQALAIITVQSLILLPIGVLSYLIHFVLLDAFPHNDLTDLFGASLLGSSRVEAVALILSVTGLIYVFKRINKTLYGLIEVLAGFVAQSDKVAAIMPGNIGNPSASKYVAMIATLYFISRGISNIVEGIEDKRKKPSRSLREILLE